MFRNILGPNSSGCSCSYQISCSLLIWLHPVLHFKLPDTSLFRAKNLAVHGREAYFFHGWRVLTSHTMRSQPPSAISLNGNPSIAAASIASISCQLSCICNNEAASLAVARPISGNTSCCAATWCSSSLATFYSELLQRRLLYASLTCLINSAAIHHRKHLRCYRCLATLPHRHLMHTFYFGPNGEDLE